MFVVKSNEMMFSEKSHTLCGWGAHSWEQSPHLGVKPYRLFISLREFLNNAPFPKALISSLLGGEAQHSVASAPEEDCDEPC